MNNGIYRNNNYDSYLRGTIAARRELLDGKRGEARRKFFEKWAEPTKRIRERLRKCGEAKDYTIIVPDPNYSEYYILIYKEPFLFDGSKADFINYLWENVASYCTPSQYDCTGQHFTTSFKVAHIGGNRWKVAEYMAVDV